MPRLSKIGAAALAAFGWTSGGSSVTATYLVVAGGGGGGSGESSRAGGGGGAGGLLSGTTSLNPTLSYTVTVGAGGVGGVDVTSNSNTSGSNSVFNAITSTGGGAGGTTGTNAGQNGGSGGGGCAGSAAGTGTSGQGSAGGVGQSAGTSYGGGGGGASAAGTNGSSGVGGTGGAGTASSISGSSVTYAGGGGGGLEGTGTQGAGGAGGGGTGNNGAGTNGTSGTANLGGGGGGAGKGTSGAAVNGGSGGSGIVIISYVGAQQFGGGVVTTDGTNSIHTFATSGTLSVLVPLTAQYLVVAGGASGGGNSAGGGGAGGLLTGSGLTIDTNSNYVVTVGAGGAGVGNNTTGNNGSGSSFNAYTTTGGGGGGGSTPGAAAGNRGGSGGGGQSGGNGANGGAGNTPSTSPSQGNNGGGTPAAGGTYPAGGGGGAGAVGGTPATNTSAGGAGGIGVASSINGTSTYYSGGGGGGSGGTAGAGGNGGGGAGVTSGTGVAGTANTGGGGGGGGTGGGAGGSGIVIIAYPGSTQSMAGGTVTISGGNVIHTFTSSGYLTPIKYASRSLRTRASASAYLNRTFGSTGNTKTWTWSGWVKRGTLGTKQNIFGQVDLSVTNRQCYVSFETDNTLSFVNYTTSGFNYYLRTTQVFRDPSAWYHIVVVSDTSQATAANRLNMYINGIQVTAFGTATYPSQNFDGWINANAGSGVQLGISRTAPYDTTEYFDGYQTEVNFVDGAALTPSSFGTFNSFGVWQPITYGGSYGTNGFYLTFGNNASTTTLGYDTSPQGNNWTTNNISVTAGATYDSMLDVPTLTSATVANYPTLSPLIGTASANYTLNDGNLKLASSAMTGHINATMAATSGKYYWECIVVSVSSNNDFSVGVDIYGTASLSASMGQSAGSYTIYSYSGNTYLQKRTNSSGTLTNTTAAVTNDIIMVAMDVGAGYVWWGKNGTWIDSGNPATGANPMYTGLTGTLIPGVNGGGGSTSTTTLSHNFGQQGFTYTPPSGFVALNTYNLSTPTIANGAAQFAATTYTGTGAALTIANTVNGTNFQPDLVWVKSRSAATDHKLTDVLRGVTKALISNTAGAETTDTNGLTAFGSTGFTLGTDTTYNNSAATYVGWQWKANGAGVSNTSGTITSTVSVNTTAGFSIVLWTGNGLTAATVGHGLNVVPAMIICKERGGTDYWHVKHQDTPSNTNLYLNVTNANTSAASVGDGVLADLSSSTTFGFATAGSPGNVVAVNENGVTNVAYCFAAVAGYSAFGSYTGNGSTDGPFVFLGFRPRFVMTKRIDTTSNWYIQDTSRSSYNVQKATLFAESSAAEAADGGLDFLSNGFKLRNTDSSENASGGTYIYMAFAENPFKYSSAR